MPTPSLVAEIVERLHRGSGSQAPGFVEIRDLHHVVPSGQRASFQQRLTMAIWRELVRRGHNPCDPAQTRLRMFDACDGELPVEVVGARFTFKRLHFDPHSIFFCHWYETPSNVRGGSISLVDARRYLEETGTRLEDAFVPMLGGPDDGRLVARNGHRERMLAEFAFQVRPPTPRSSLLLIVRNDPLFGVAHEIEAIAPAVSGVPMRRRFVRTSVAPVH